MSANAAEVTPEVAAPAPAVPKRITNAQTVCNEKNAKGKLCNGHLKQLKTAGEAAEVHLRGDDVLFKCQICGTLYMGPPLGHVRDPEKQTRFVENELAALLQAAGGTLPVIEKNAQGVYVMVESASPGHATPSAKPVAAKPAEAKAAPAQPAAAATPKAAAQPNRQLNKRTSYAGVVDTGPVPGETQTQKIERLKKVVAGAKQRSEEGGAEHATDSSPAAVAAPVTEAAKESAPDPVPQTTAPAAASHTGNANPDRTLFKRTTYAGVVDTGPVAGETHEQKVDRLTKLAAAVKQRSEEG